MRKSLPNYIFEKEYNSFYLFINNEIFNNKDFISNLFKFSEENKGELLKFQVLIPNKFYTDLIKEYYIYPLYITNNSFDFFELYVKDGNEEINMSWFNFLVSDEKRNWELYCSDIHEICILGYDFELSNIIDRLFKPYYQISLHEKLNFIGNRFFSNIDKERYINKILKNYKLKLV